MTVGARPAAVEFLVVSKRYGPVAACRDVTLAVRPGEVHGLLGENGAGKTTLMKILVGLVPPDSGEVLVAGRPTVVRDPAHAASLGVVMAQQHFSLVERLTVWENVALAEQGPLRRRAAAQRVEEVSARYGVSVDPFARVQDLTSGQRQRVELVKWLSVHPSVLVLDEPTSVLTAAESRELFTELRRLVADEQLAVILISHNLDEILHATDRVTVLRAGSVVTTVDTSDTDAGKLARAMVGHDVVIEAERAAIGLSPMQAAAPTLVPSAPAPVALRVADVSARGRSGRLDGLSFEVASGEIVGIAGVEGNGQAAIGDLLSGLARVVHGTIEVGGLSVPPKAAALLGAGVSVIPEDPRSAGLVLSMTVEENLVAADLQHYRAHGFLDRRAMRRRAEELMREYGIAAPSPRTPVASLSGGNQQRVVVARELSRRPAVLVAVQPTRGLDVAAIEQLTKRLRSAATDGAAVVLVSTELDQLLAVVDRLLVLYSGRVVGEMLPGAVDAERLGLLMGGRVA